VRKAEAAIEVQEARITELRTALEDEALYVTGEGARQAAAVQAELTAAERALDDTMNDWAMLTEALERARNEDGSQDAGNAVAK
jgi:hypothetical protein